MAYDKAVGFWVGHVVVDRHLGGSLLHGAQGLQPVHQLLQPIRVRD
jgi:hypothetical protein